MEEQKKEKTIYTDAYIVESTRPSEIVGGNDVFVQEALHFAENELRLTLPTIRFDFGSEELSNDVAATKILTEKSVLYHLLKSESVEYRTVLTDAFGRPKAQNGLGMLLLAKQLNDTSDVSLKIVKPEQEEISVKLNKNIALEVAGVALDALDQGLRIDFSEDENLKTLFKLSSKDKVSQKEGVAAIQAINSFVSKHITDENQKKKVYSELDNKPHHLVIVNVQSSEKPVSLLDLKDKNSDDILSTLKNVNVYTLTKTNSVIHKPKINLPL